MITMSARRLTIGVACLMISAAAPNTASAQDYPYVPNFFRVEPQTYADVPNVPDVNGCVKMCFRDLSPCDPWTFKHADNRCNSTNGR